MTSREAMLFMKYEHYGKCKGSFKDSQRKCKYLDYDVERRHHDVQKIKMAARSHWTADRHK